MSFDPAGSSCTLANDVAKLTIPGKALYTCMLNESGGVIDDLIVYFFTPERYRLVVNAATCPSSVVAATSFKAWK